MADHPSNELGDALAAFQSELVTVAKDSENPFFKSKYADLASILRATQPVLTKHGLSVVQLPDNIDGQPALKTIVMHTSGDRLEATTPLVLAKNDPQGLGSAITYMRRYAYAAALQIVIDEDDDGNSASRRQEASQKPVKPAVGAVEAVQDVFPGAEVTDTATPVTRGQAQLLLSKAQFKWQMQDAVKTRDEFIAKYGKAVEDVTYPGEFNEIMAGLKGEA